MRFSITAGLAALVLLLAGCGGDGGGEITAPEGPCTAVPQPEPKTVDLNQPPSEPSAGSLKAVVDTSCGTIEIALDTQSSPKTVASFEYLADNGVFDGTPWRIAINPPVIQGGDPQGTGLGGPGYSVVEAPPQDAEYTRGVVAMAKTEVEQPGTSGSQFFIVTAADAGLQPIYAIVGEVSEGFDVVRTITSFGDPSGQSEEPLAPVVIDSVTIEPG